MSDFTDEELQQIANAVRGAERWTANLLGRSIHGHTTLLDGDLSALRKAQTEVERLERSINTRREVLRRLNQIKGSK